ncbi:MAG: DnaJ domain-containing protein [Myxococcaceae bacterium]
MNAALRQATYVGPPPSAPTKPREEKTDPHIVMPVPLTQPLPLTQAAPPPAPSAPRAPLKLGGEAQTDADLWSAAQPATATPTGPGGVQSFEEALRRVDSSLEALVGTQPRAPQQPEPLVEPIIEADIVAPPPVAPKPSDELDSADEARLRRQRLLKRAMENLGTMPQRDPLAPPSSSGSGITAAPPGVPTSTGSQPALRPPPPSTTGSQLAFKPPAPSAPASTGSQPALKPAPPPSAADQQLSIQIEARFAQLARKDHFLTLGIAPTSTREQVKSAFLNLAKTFHPDRLPPSLPHLAQKMSAVFEGIRDAYETLYDDTKRQLWLATRATAVPVAGPGATGSTGSQAAHVPTGAQANEAFKLGENYFKKRDYKNAEAQFAKAYSVDKSANSLAAQAWCIYMDPTRKAEGQQARALMQKALQLDNDCDRAHYQLGVIARVEGDMDRAERHFREAVRVNARHLEANQELRLIEMRKKKAQQAPPKGGGFFG